MKHPHRVLVADDYPLLAEGLAESIEAECVPMCRADVAVDGNQAIQFALANRPSAAILNVDLPGKNGLEVAAAILAAYPAETPLLIGIAGGESTWTQAVESGLFSRVLRKPIDVGTLLVLLRGALS